MGSLPFCHLSFRSKIQKAGFPVEVKTLGDAIRKRRLELGIRQIDAAHIIGCDHMSIVNWEKNYNEPRITHMTAVVQFLGYDPMPECDNLAHRLVCHRSGRGITQKAFATELGIDPTTLARWERGEREPKGRFRAMVAEALGRRERGASEPSRVPPNSLNRKMLQFRYLGR